MGTFGGGEATQALTVENGEPKTIDITGFVDDSFDTKIIAETRKEVNNYLFVPEKIQLILPHLNIFDNFGRPKHYSKNNKL